MGKTVAIINQKGGVGKTTTCVNLAAALTEAGKKILLCDFDPQANSTSGMGVDKTVSKGVYEVIIGGIPTDEAISHTRWRRNSTPAFSPTQWLSAWPCAFRLENLRWLTDWDFLDEGLRTIEGKIG